MEVNTEKTALSALLDHEYNELISAFDGSHKYSEVKKFVVKALSREVCKNIGLRWFNVIAHLHIKNSLFDRLLRDLESEKIEALGSNPKTGKREKIAAEHWAFARRNRAVIRQPGNSIVFARDLSNGEAVSFNGIDLIFRGEGLDSELLPLTPPTENRNRPGRKVRDEWMTVAAVACRWVDEEGMKKTKAQFVNDILAVQDSLQLDNPYKEDQVKKLVDAIYRERDRETDSYEGKARI